jgi:hypothetical protein
MIETAAVMIFDCGLIDAVGDRSEGVVALGDDVVGGFDVGYQDVPVSDVNAELLFQSFVDVNAGLDVDASGLIPPVCIEGNGHSLTIAEGTFHRSGSIWLSLLWTALMILLATRPG